MIKFPNVLQDRQTLQRITRGVYLMGSTKEESLWRFGLIGAGGSLDQVMINDSPWHKDAVGGRPPHQNLAALGIPFMGTRPTTPTGHTLGLRDAPRMRPIASRKRHRGWGPPHPRHHSKWRHDRNRRLA